MANLTEYVIEGYANSLFEQPDFYDIYALSIDSICKRSERNCCDEVKQGLNIFNG